MARMMPPGGKRLKLISCEVFFRELVALVAESPHVIDIEFLQKGLHDIGAVNMMGRIQAAVDAVDSGLYEGILMGYGLCNNGLAGLTARAIPIVLPRANDCISLFMGSSTRYLSYFQQNPGVYFMTTGWRERGEAASDLKQVSIPQQMGMNSTMEELIAKYGEDNAQFLYETLVENAQNYSQYTYIDMGHELDAGYIKETQQEADRRGWRFSCIPGNRELLARLINGPWNDDEFLTILPGQRVRPTYENERIIEVENVPLPL